MINIYLFPQLPFTAPDWASLSSNPRSTNFNDGIVIPSRRIADNFLAESPPAKNAQYEKFINRDLLTPLFNLMNSKFELGDFSRLRGLGAVLPDSIQEKANWEEMVDNISRRLNEPALKPYSTFDKFKLAISMLNEMWFTKKNLFIFRTATQERDSLSHFNNLEVANVLEELHYAPLGRPLNAYFLHEIPLGVSEYVCKYDAAGCASLNLDMIKLQSLAVSQSSVPRNFGSALSVGNLSTSTLRAGTYVAGKLVHGHSPSDLYALSVQDSFVRVLSSAAHHTQQEVDLGRQIVTLDSTFFTTFAEKKLKEGGLLHEIYKAQKADPRRRPLDPILEYAIFQLACSFKKGELKEPNVMLYQWVDNVLPIVGTSVCNPEQFFYSKFAIQLLADELGITQNSLDVSNYSKYHYENLANQAIALADKSKDEISAALVRVYTREFESSIDSSIFQAY